MGTDSGERGNAPPNIKKVGGIYPPKIFLQVKSNYANLFGFMA